jgi:uncharacterized protein
LIERLPYLQLRLLPRGSIERGLPDRDVALLVTTASLVARADLHPALQQLAAEATVEVHSAAGPFHRAGDFPTLRRIEFPASAQARRALVHGPTWLEEQMGFWGAQVAVRVLLICLPIALLACWFAQGIPAYLRWLLESRIARWYGELKYIEHDMADPSLPGIERIRLLQRLQRIENGMADFATPPDLMARWFTLREHIQFVKARLHRGRGR